MNNQPPVYASTPAETRSRNGRWVAAMTGLASAMLIFITAVLITFIMPETYSAAATVKAEGPAALEREAVQVTPDQLRAVVEKLDLNQRWASRFSLEEPLTSEESAQLLSARLSIERIRNTSVLRVTAYAEQPQEAADLANALAAEVARGGGVLLSQAVPSLRPVRPNKPLNLVIGAAVALLGGGIVAGAVMLLSRTVGRMRGVVTVPA